ncbi:MAG: hypothetical protein R3C61_23525 [Bacteroidia bacterium]
MGFNFEVGYKNIRLSADIQGQFGNEIYNGKKAVRPELYNFETSVLNRWTGEGTSDTEPRLTAGGLNYSPSSWFVEDGSFVRLRNVSLIYDLPSDFLSRFQIGQASIYLRGTNLLTLTKFTGYSPEIASFNVLSSGIDLGIYPVTTIYSAGINLNF